MSIHPKARAIISKLSIPSPIKKYFSDRDWDIDLSNNTNPYVEGFSEYPDINQEDLKNLYLSRVLHLNSSHDMTSKQKLTPENILFTVGSMEGIDILLRTFCEPNKDTICILHPTFSAYEHWGLIHNLEVKNISLSGENLNTFSLDEVVKINPKMVFICNPNNPIGTSLTSEMIKKLCQSITGFVVVDEAYMEFSDQSSSMVHLNEHKNLIILRTFSKAWGLAGVRCGIILADKLIIHTLRYIQLPFGFSSPAQDLVQKCLSNPDKTFASWKRTKKDRQNLIDTLSTLEAVKKVFKSETNFIMIVLKDRLRVLDLLKEHKIQVLDCSESVPSSIRVSLGTEEQNEKFVEIIRGASYV
jgi:histidinol-phosphate aminotransferase